MRSSAKAFLALALLAVGSSVSAWDISYEGDVFPNDPSLGSAAWRLDGDLSLCSVSNGVFRMVDTWSDKKVCFNSGPSAAPGIPVTLEARLRVFQSSYTGHSWTGPVLCIGTLGGWAPVGLSRTGVFTHYYGEESDRSHNADMTVWRTIRIALSAQEHFDVWLDGIPVFSTNSDASWQGGNHFGTPYYLPATADIEWDYIRYSNAYISIPEPSCLSILSLALVGVGVGRLRRRR